MSNPDGFEMSRMGVKSAHFSVSEQQRGHSRSGSNGGFNGGVTTSMSSGKRLDVSLTICFGGTITASAWAILSFECAWRQMPISTVAKCSRMRLGILLFIDANWNRLLVSM